jgi:hypothetical protein
LRHRLKRGCFDTGILAFRMPPVAVEGTEIGKPPPFDRILE